MFVWDKLSDVENWVKQRYVVLAREFENKSFRLEDAEKVLKKAGIETGNVKELLSILRKKGLLEVEKDPEDFRRSIYRLLFVEKSVSLPRDKLFRSLKAGADLIRGGVDYKVLLLFIFYKALSDKWNALVDKFIAEGRTKTQAYLLTNRKYYVLYDENEQKLLTWHEVTKSRETLAELANALTRISRLNKKLVDLEKLVEILGFKGFISEDNLHTIESIIQIFNSLDFSKIPYDVVADAYMWILNYFAPQKAKEGENYTPIEIVKLVINLLDIEINEENGVVTVLDPALGSGSMLIVSRDYIRKKYGKEAEDVLMLYGQERNEIMGVIAKMNLILHDIKNYEIFIGDSLANPRFPQCDYVVANPPWNQDYNVNGLIEDPKVKRIYTQFINTFPPKNSIDWGWIQLMLYHAKKKVGIILDNGALFRGGSEKRIREAVVKKDLIEAVVLLPEKLFYNTGAPGIVIIFNKNKPEERKGKILFINASQEFEKHPEIRRLNRLGEKNIEKIVNAYREFKNIEGFAKVVSIEEIAKNDYNLNVTLYVVPIEEGEEINIAEEFEELKKIETERRDAERKLEKYISQIIHVFGGNL